MKVIDSFLFFQEFELLEIRLRYLDPFVDIFVIFEANQTFSGASKNFNYEINQERFKKYKNKILYYKFDHQFNNYFEIQEFLRSESKICKNIAQMLDRHDYYPKSDINWVLDACHRECMHIPIDSIASQDDLVLFSDIDEIPNEEFFKVAIHEKERPVLSVQNEFDARLNRYKGNRWSGTISGTWVHLRDRSFNDLRKNALKKDKKVFSLVNPGGYHFSSCASIQDIKDKIRAYGHQEFNNFITLNFIELNISYGKDIFWRNDISYQILGNESNLIDARMQDIINCYPHLVSPPIKKSISINIVLILAKLVFRVMRKLKLTMGVEK
jgi:beta-1,4-mannosyl-glycoprotein beta-1,4-N-acetylglucosaminyltransferase